MWPFRRMGVRGRTMGGDGDGGAAREREEHGEREDQCGEVPLGVAFTLTPAGPEASGRDRRKAYKAAGATRRYMCILHACH